MKNCLNGLPATQRSPPKRSRVSTQRRTTFACLFSWYCILALFGPVRHCLTQRCQRSCSQKILLPRAHPGKKEQCHKKEATAKARGHAHGQ
eukprot:3531140-Rhodomonas_salina.2